MVLTPALQSVEPPRRSCASAAGARVGAKSSSPLSGRPSCPEAGGVLFKGVPDSNVCTMTRDVTVALGRQLLAMCAPRPLSFESPFCTRNHVLGNFFRRSVGATGSDFLGSSSPSRRLSTVPTGSLRLRLPVHTVRKCTHHDASWVDAGLRVERSSVLSTVICPGLGPSILRLLGVTVFRPHNLNLKRTASGTMKSMWVSLGKATR
jgi:hypothetical protein